MVNISQSKRGNSTLNEAAFRTGLDQAMELVLTENHQVLQSISQPEITELAQRILFAESIFAVGEGRSGLVIRMVAMRLMHLGLQAYVVGETTTPSIQPGDLLIACSGSGSSEVVSTLAAEAKEQGGIVVAITTQTQSSLAEIAELIIKINAPTKQDQSHQQSKQFAGSLFEQSTLLLFDALFYALSQNLNKSSETLLALHTNLE
jgi:6-phospho-3-hexuloisomerase